MKILKILKGMKSSKHIVGNAIAICILIWINYTGTDVPKLDPEIEGMIIAFFNIILRFFTNKPLAEKTKLLE